MIKGSEILGLKIYALTRGEVIERARDLVFNPSTNRLVGILTSKEGLFGDAKLIPLENVISFGRDAIIIESPDFILSAKDLLSDTTGIIQVKKFLINNDILTEDGKHLGKVTDIYFDDKTGIVVDYELSQGLGDLLSGRHLISVDSIVSLGKDAVIVRSGTELLNRQKEERKISEQSNVASTNKRLHQVNDQFTEQPAIYSQIKRR